MIPRQRLLEIRHSYSVQPVLRDGRMGVLVGSETKGPNILLEGPEFTAKTICGGPGGTMMILPVPNRSDQFVSIMGLYPPFIGRDAGLFLHEKKDTEKNDWRTQKLTSLPFAHRLEFMEADNRLFLLVATVAEDKDSPEDWSKPGSVFAADVTEGIDQDFMLEPLASGITRNHGMSRAHWEGKDVVLVSGANGVHAIYRTGGNWVQELLMDREVSEVCLEDLDGDGNPEMVTIEPFHGDYLRFYRQEGGAWKPVHEFPLDFGHGLTVGKIGGVPSVFVGNRRGDRELLWYSINPERNLVTRRVVDEGVGPTQTFLYEEEGRSFLISSNPVSGEVVRYQLDAKAAEYKITLVKEGEVEIQNVPGRKLRWLFHPDEKKADGFSMNVITIDPGETVRPAHCHPKEEEVIYVIEGHGRVFVEGELAELEPGCAVLFPPGAVHMVRNSGKEPMKIICFFTPPVDFSQYQYFEDVSFPG